MRQLLLIALVSLSFASGSAQTFATKLAGNSFTTDHFGYYYDISDTEISKYDQQGKLDCSYSNNVLGVIANVDVTNPYKILVYFRDFTKVLILDNTLSPTSEVIDLTEINLDETTLTCRSYNEGTWYYNPVKFELVRKNKELVTTNTSGNLANLLDKNLQPSYLLEYNNKVYLNDTVNGILVFDMYGTYLKTIPIYKVNQFQVKDKFMVYVKENGTIEIYDFFTLQFNLYEPLKYGQTEKVRIENDMVYIVDKNNELIIDKISE